MIHQVKENIWFDADKLYIISGAKNYESYVKNINKYPVARVHWNEAGRKKRVAITFLSSTRCNLQCVYCYAKHGTYNDISEKDTFTFENYVKAYQTVLKESGNVGSICFFGGEPLLGFKEIKKFIEYLHENYPADEIPLMAFGSNGTIMSDEIIDCMEKYRIAFSTSLDGPKEFNDMSRVGRGIESVYDKVTDNLRKLKRTNLPLAVQFTLNQVHVRNYQKGQIIEWAKTMESLPVMRYEIVMATTDNPAEKINLEDYNSYSTVKLMFEEYADYILDKYIIHDTKVIPIGFNSIMINIFRRTYTCVCGAGCRNVTISPDMKIYPCHIIADSIDKSVPCVEGYEYLGKQNVLFARIADQTRDTLQCSICIAKNICTVYCKGMLNIDLQEQPKERCIMMEVFAKKVITFLVEKYPLYKNEVNEYIREIANRQRL